MLRSSLPFFLLFLIASFGESQHQQLFSSVFGYPGVDASYDYVVVGAGVGGSVVASRLAEDGASVALVEAGGFYEVENSNRSVVPLLSLTGIAFIDPSENFTQQPLMDWGLLSEPIPGAANRRVHYAQGKTLGGSSAINTMSYLRGSKSSYQRLADMVDDQSWAFDNLLKYFKKSCQLAPPNLEKRNSTNATVIYDPAAFDPSGGPLQVSWNNWVDPTLTWIAKAIEEIGLPLSSKGFSSGELVGHGAWIPSTIDPTNAHRSSAESSFLQNAIRNSSNLAIYTHTQATRILFDSSSPPKATGVIVNTQGVEYIISAFKEVIISAGTFHSPQLLMVSGIGPKATLDTRVIPLIVDLPGVGQNLSDPIRVSIANSVSTSSGQTLTGNLDTAPGYVQQYLDDASGPFSSAADYIAAERIPYSFRKNFTTETKDKLATYPDDWPETLYIPASFIGANFSTIGSTTAWMPIAFSRGSVSITSARMADPPSISLNWLSDPADAEIAVAAFKRLRHVWDTDAANTVKLGEELLPGPGVQTDEQILEYVRETAGQIWHPVGTCSMGQEGDEAAVVNSKGQVFGVHGLRVVDASILPFTIPTHTQGTVYALAEKIADDIKQAA
ncbi:uncharacterized protein BCR38DRAFT_456055 [Pseudomassariella vexata]|uniref:Glucose-methanol-choline oxidoreductase N-terminal domain-containing protein n=1 Tax=Pseudomassariella vexata TaxID=1141098 RepID=A0A1Y2E6N1_9PEZI|nr:uncharacterized protein BCR38DRAFT_456055 [Pseudomassariella vexata]ORY67233.1 hypothetical protein BCR38DRAFT_456055 [Pseudomassariella vexata]